MALLADESLCISKTRENVGFCFTIQLSAFEKFYYKINVWLFPAENYSGCIICFKCKAPDGWVSQITLHLLKGTEIGLFTKNNWSAIPPHAIPFDPGLICTRNCKQVICHMIDIPGPFAPPGRRRPNLKITALSYSCTI